MNHKSLILAFFGILLSVEWAHAYYEEKLSHPQVPQMEILPAVQGSSSMGDNVTERPLPPAQGASVQTEPATPSIPDVSGKETAPTQPPSIPAQPKIDSVSGPGLLHVGKHKPAVKITSRGKKIPMDAAMQLIIPQGWHIDTQKMGKKHVSWNAKSKPWTEILSEIAKQCGARITVDWNTAKVLCEPAAQQQELISPNSISSAAKGGIVKKAIIARPGTGREVARRYHLPVEDFCRWNHFGPSTPLSAGYEVYLMAPPPGTIVVANIPNEVPTGAEKAALSHFSEVPPMPTPVAVSLPDTVAPVPAAPISPTISPVVMPQAPASDTTLEPLPEAQSLWEITEGQMLRSQMEGWAAVAGYSLIWNALNDYEMRSSATFTGIFIDAVKNFFAALQSNGLALRVTIYQGNKVMEVSEQ